MRRFFLLIAFSFLSLSVLAQQEMEIIPLKHRMVEQILPTIQPLVEPGGTLTGMNNQLILRASRRNIEQIKQAIAALDQSPRRLMIYVTQNRDHASQQQGVDVSGKVWFGDNVRVIQPPQPPQTSLPTQQGGRVDIQSGDSRVTVRGGAERSNGKINASQSVQVIEGGQAFIQVGESQPLPVRQVVRGPNGVSVTETTVYQDSGRGFYAVPRLSGDRVTIEINPRYDTPNTQIYGAVNTQRIVTTVSGRLGDWIELGGVNQQSSGSTRGNLSSGSGESRDNRSVWLLVEELK